MQENHSLVVHYYGATDIGLVRTENQDSFGKFPKDNSNTYQSKGVLFIVADGMGGHSGGKEASSSAVEIVSQEYFNYSSDIVVNSLLYAFKAANLKIHQSSSDVPQFQKKGTTCSALVLENELAHIAHIGDSRIYKIADGKIIQLTKDHTEVGEMFRKGILSEEEVKIHPSKSVLVRAMGIEADIEVDLIDNIRIYNGDRFILCSDGLTKITDQEIKDVVLNNSPEDACNKLISLANESGGKDNVTVQVIMITSNQIPEISSPKPTIKKNSRKLWWIIFLAVILSLIVIVGIIYQAQIKEIFFKDSNNTDTHLEENITNQPELSESILENANDQLSRNNPDSALVLYNLILAKNPLHIGALNGKELVFSKYVEKGNQFLAENKMDIAKVFYTKALTLNPDDKQLEIKLNTLQKWIETKSDNVINKTDIIIEEKEVVKSENQGDLDKSLPKSIKLDNFNWITEGLSNEQVKLDEDRFIFFNTNKNKMLFYLHQLEDIDIEADLKFNEGTDNYKAGIIIGYNISENTGIEDYYLFTVDNSGTFSLIKAHNDKVETLLSIKRSLDISKKFYRLKIKCLGPWVMIYNDGKLLDSYLSKDFIKGRIGLYSESYTYAEFSNIQISSAFENK